MKDISRPAVISEEPPMTCEPPISQIRSEPQLIRNEVMCGKVMVIRALLISVFSHSSL